MTYQNQIADAKWRREVARKRRFADLGGKLKSTGRQRGRHPLERRRPRRRYVKARRLLQGRIALRFRLMKKPAAGAPPLQIPLDHEAGKRS